MLSQTCKILKFLFIACFLFIARRSSAQTSYHNIIFTIDSLIEVGLPKSALMEVDKLDALARKENNVPQMVRAVIYHAKFLTYLQEDALVSVITTLKADIGRSSYPVKPVLQSFLADMYWNYYQQNRYTFTGRSKMEVPDIDFRKWDLATIIDETTKLYQLSLQDADQEQNTPLDILDGILQGDKNTRFLRPTLYDLLLHRASDFFLADEPALTKPKMPFSLNDPRFFGDSKTFAALDVKTTDTASTFYRGIRLLQQGLAFHLQKNNRRALADLDMKRLTFLYDKATLSNKNTLYLAALKNIAADTSAGVICGDALFAIGKYYGDADSLHTAMIYLQKAMAGYPKSPAGQRAGNQINEITQKELQVSFEDVNSPDVPILAGLKYRNISQARYRIYGVTDAQLTYIGKLDGNYGSIGIGKSTLAFIKTLKALQDKQLNLPATTDLKEHTTEFKIDALKPGKYLLLATEQSGKDSLIQLGLFKVSGLAYIIRTRPDRKREIKVTNRETGDMLAGAAVTITYSPERYGNTKKKPVIITGITDINGSFMFDSKGNQYTININYRDDHLADGEKDEPYSPQPILNSAPVIRTVFFTDRQIYRPGQTIYFKAMELQSVNGKSSIITKADLDIKLSDQNNKELGTTKLKTNEFGTVAASFVIPQNVLNGWLSLSTANGRIAVHVEEYKRPTFKVDFEPFTQFYKLGDSILVKGKVNAFSGYGLSGARVAYNITRVPQIRPYFNAEYSNKRSIDNDDNQQAIIAVDTIKTDEQGNFKFKFLANGPDNENKGQTCRFSIQANVTDANSETHFASSEITISDIPIRLEADVPEKAIGNQHANAALTIFNGNDEKQNGRANIKVYELKGPEAFFKNRLWDVPDQWLMSKTDYEKYFPNFAYNHENEYSNWQRQEKTADLDIDIQKSGNTIDLNKLLKSTGGIYALVISAKNENGDTASVVKYINYIADKAPIQKSEDWVTAQTTTVAAKEPATFYIGIGKACKVLFETYDGPTLLSSQLLQLQAGAPQKISVPVVPTNKNAFTVQFELVNGNRQYHYYQRIMVKDTVKPLNIRFLTMRDKLQPGEKEQWKLQIDGGDNKQTSELLAGLYDASLDDITRPLSWQADFAEYQYMARYFEWETVPPSSNDNTSGNQPYQPYYNETGRNYESIDNLDFNYDGRDNSIYRDYNEGIVPNKKNALSNKQIEARYMSNARLVKGGYDVIGKVIWRGSLASGVKISISNSIISTTTNSYGYFRIKVPAGSILTFSGKGYISRKIRPVKGVKMIVLMKIPMEMRRELAVADPGVKSQKGDPNQDIRIDEPVGNADIKQEVEESTSYFAAAPNNKLKRYAGYISYDNAAKADTVILREIQTKPGQKFDKELLAGRAGEIGAAPIVTRKNFNETAFFYPQLHTNDNGKVLIDFTVPESLTRWKFRGFAHNKDLQSGYIEQEVITQKKMMISANMPRFLREGDTLVVSARVVNLSNQHLKGQAKLEFTNAVTLQPVALFGKSKYAEQPFELDSTSTGAVSFKLVIPTGLEALTYRLTASAGNYTDGEENTLPVLPNSMLVTETMPMMVRPGQTKNFTFDKLVNQTTSTLTNKTLTLEYTQNPAWTAVQALPYLMEFPYECSEQIFSRFYANSFAVNIVNHYPQIKKVFEQWKIADSKALLSNLEKNPELKSVLLEETPWLQDAVDETEQKKRIALLFDLNKMSYELNANLTKLKQKQLANGGFPWFGGDFSDRYITQHILAGIGQLMKLNVVDKDNTTLPQIIPNALNYVDNELKADEANAKKHIKNYMVRDLDNIEVHAWYAQSYFKKRAPDAAMDIIRANYLARASRQWVQQPEFEKAMIALTLYRFDKKETAAEIMKSLLETAQQSDELGMYWAANKPGYYWYQSPVETQSLMIELFTEAGNNTKAVEEMKIWLLRNKQTNNWRTTKATAAACYALLIRGDNILTDTTSINISLNNKPLASLKPGIKAEAGTGYLKTTWVDEQVKPALGHVQVSNSSKTINWGAMYWQYTEKLDKITPSNTNVQLERKYFIQKQTDAGPILTAVDAIHQPKTGDVLKVVVYLKADRDFDYIQLKDMRPAGTEPMETLSAYKYQDGLYYYQVSKDVATNFFISALKKGNYVFEYALRVVQPGNYATGVTSLQSMYAPEFNAHTEGRRIEFKP
ncbi:alpha-2-macroglobulin family protein [Mucilaginibacter ginsenosidivorax]|uniref:Alpha-2-macroglobulin domain-containing protein n=1 Tax=Mucilaginibacter ginsenosidivorax TaxID=862126 RepID=A0A5B8WEE7_9SPHI|nr:alpha-2-macroglobulin family protein [Mucilaginibacter ginsenosidivorax]QEC80228.1 hypothetical protein FSB76_31305 [Mucilaginibacter ginsenosidivorax]